MYVYVSISFIFQSYEFYSVVNQKYKTVFTIAVTKWKLKWYVVVLPQLPLNQF
jgi:hypothetical protein